MSISYATTARNARMSALVTALGASAQMRFYSGTKPTPATWSNATAALASVVFGTDVTAANGGTAGGVSNGTLTFGGYTQTSSGFTAGTPTWVALVTSGNVCVAIVDIGSGSANIQFTGSIATGQNITGSLSITDGNA